MVSLFRLALGVLCFALANACSSGTEAGHPPLGAPGVGCFAGQQSCSGACVELTADPRHCGTCARSCSADQLCDQGACKPKEQGCSAGLAACGGGCVNTASSTAHCGACDRTCGSEQSCNAGTCSCAAGKVACGSTCSDLMSDNANCGACGTSCAGGRTCVQGSCQCPPGRVVCGSICTDVQSDAASCGACGVTCGLGQACAAGVCGSGGAAREDGCSGLGQDLTLSEIAAYQTVEIPLMKDGAEVAAAARNTDVVIGRDTMFRVFISAGAGFVSRPLSARVFVQNGDRVDLYYEKKVLTGSSEPASAASTFQVIVPKDKITKDTQYAVELVECGAATGASAGTARFPQTDGAALAARATGGLKIEIVPLQANSRLPDTSASALEVYRALLLAMYPITDVELSVGPSLSVSDDRDWNGMLDQVRARRQAEAPASDVYYYGMMKPAATLREYCGMACTAGIGFVPQGSSGMQASQRAALGLAFADATSAETMAHEVGHNHGRSHSPCPTTGIAGVDPNYPYARAAVGVYGWDSRTQTLSSPDRTDIMGYCNNRWISDYTYDGILTRVATVDAASELIVAAELIHPWLVLLLDQGRARWGIPIDEPAAPAGQAEPAEVLDEDGQVIDVIDVYRSQISDIDAASLQVPPPLPGWHRLRVRGAAAAVSF